MDSSCTTPFIWKNTTLPETNIAPENGWLEDYFPFGKAYFQGRTVSFRDGIFFVYRSLFSIHSHRTASRKQTQGRFVKPWCNLEEVQSYDGHVG